MASPSQTSSNNGHFEVVIYSLTLLAQFCVCQTHGDILTEGEETYFHRCYRAVSIPTIAHKHVRRHTLHRRWGMFVVSFVELSLAYSIICWSSGGNREELHQSTRNHSKAFLLREWERKNGMQRDRDAKREWKLTKQNKQLSISRTDGEKQTIEWKDQ